MILFTADLHIKLGQKNVPIEWSKQRYKLFFNQVYEVEKQVDLHIIGGDIFDKAPNMDELELYFDFIRGMKVRCLIYSGNHEATKKGKTFFSALKNVTNAVNPLVTIIDEIYEEETFSIVPYEFIKEKGVWDKINPDKAVFSHIRGAIEPHVQPEIDLNQLDKFNIVYVGDLHSHSNCQRNLVYPGSPMTTSFHRHKVSTGYLLIDSNDLTKWTWHEFDLPQLIRKTVSKQSEMIATAPDHTIYEIEGSVVDLGNVKNSELLDKKLVKRSTDTALILNKDMTIDQELVEYFRYVIELPENQIEEVISAYHDNTKTT